MTYKFYTSWQQQPALIPFSLITVTNAHRPYSYGCLRVLLYVFFQPLSATNQTPLHHQLHHCTIAGVIQSNQWLRFGCTIALKASPSDN